MINLKVIQVFRQSRCDLGVSRFSLVVVILLAGCNGGGSGGSGGGGSSGGGGTASGALAGYFVQSFAPYETLANQLRTSARYLRQANRFTFNGRILDSFPLASARIEYAHAVGLTGRGQTIAISDGGFLTTHETLAGHSITVVGSPPVSDHGTTVASIAVGNSASMIGVAPAAGLILGPIGNQDDLAATAELARTRNAVALNNSWGYTIDVSQQAFNTVFSGSDGARYLAALRAYAGQGVVVFALTNNEFDTRSDLLAALPLIDPNLTDGWLAVGNAVPVYDANRIISARRLSSRCLEAAAWCLVADGFWDAADAQGVNSYSTGTGSSYAAPQVSGALAILAEAFPTLTPHDLRLRLLASADNDFFVHSGTVELVPGFTHGYNLEFGHGFLDLRAALLPIGAATLSANGEVIALEGAAVYQGSALGDAVETGLSQVDLTVTDSLRANFGLQGGDLALRSAPLPLAARVLSRPSGHAADPVAGFAEFAGSETELALADAPVTLRMLLPQGDSASMGLSVSNRLGGDAAGLDLGLALVRDGGEVFGLGGGPSGAGTMVASLSVGFDARLGQHAFLRLGAEAGIAQAAGGGILGRLDNLGVNAFSAEIGAQDVLAGGDRLVLGLTTPLAVTSGNARTSLSTFAADGSVAITELAIPLAPVAREHVLAIGYDLPLAENASLRLDLAHAANWGNRGGASETAGGITLAFAF